MDDVMGECFGDLESAESFAGLEDADSFMGAPDVPGILSSIFGAVPGVISAATGKPAVPVVPEPPKQTGGGKIFGLSYGTAAVGAAALAGLGYIVLRKRRRR